MPDIKEFNILRKNRFVFNFPSKTFSIYIYIIKESLYTSSDLFTTLMSGVRDWKNVYYLMAMYYGMVIGVYIYIFRLDKKVIVFFCFICTLIALTVCQVDTGEAETPDHGVGEAHGLHQELHQVLLLRRHLPPQQPPPRHL